MQLIIPSLRQVETQHPEWRPYMLGDGLEWYASRLDFISRGPIDILHEEAIGKVAPLLQSKVYLTSDPSQLLGLKLPTWWASPWFPSGTAWGFAYW